MRLFLLFAFIALVLLETHGFTYETDREALLVFKSQVSKDTRDLLYSWNHSLPLCNWKGVTCGRRHKRITRLDLGGLQLGGVISPSTGNLSFLRYLDLSNNSFGGAIPQEMGNLFRLENLYLEMNNLGGGIPVSLFNCTRLLELYLDTNHLGGGVPWELGSLTKLRSLDFGLNKLQGKLPASLGNLTSLVVLVFGGNNLKGEIPADIARLSHMVDLDLSLNNFSGIFPPGIYNMSALEDLHMSFNHFSGHLRPEFGILLPNLKELNVGANFLTGSIPSTLCNISALQKVGLYDNNFTGSIPVTFGKLQNMQRLTLYTNSLGSYSFGDLEFLGALTNCTKLEVLQIAENRLGGDLPTSISNLSTGLVELIFENNHISGRIPDDIGNLIGLQSLALNKNMLSGPLPTSLGNLFGLGLLYLSSNRMSGVIPSAIGNLTRLVKLGLSNNSFEGTIPPSLGNCRDLLHLTIAYNKLNGTIPKEIIQLSHLVNLSIAGNFITGTLPKDFGRLENLVRLHVSNNKLSGELSPNLGRCLSMEEIYLQGNSFNGTIPNIEGLVGVKRVDMSNNNFSGSIPAYFGNFSKLEYLNLSINNFEGRVPTKGKFQNSTIVSVFGNKKLCGGIKELKLKACIAQRPPVETKHLSRLRKVVIGVSVGVALLLVLFFVSLLWFRRRHKKHMTSNSAPSTLDIFHQKISYGELRNATDGFSSSNIVGSGSFGTVFKALLPTENKTVAVKVLNLQRRGAMKSFMAECESLKDIRHCNLVKLITACASIDFQGNDFRALVYEFMVTGSLDMWLHPEEIVEEISKPSRTLTLLERLNIAVDVASVLDYLHVHCYEPMAHCDLKPSNVLLDADLSGHVSDFGLARLLLKFDQESFLNQLSSAGVRGTIGYVAPEYGMGGEPSVKGDVYSFGVLLLEMFTGKRPTNELFGENITLHSYTKSALPEQVLDIVDESILHNGLRVGFPAAECLTLVLEVGLRCCEESPMNRMGTSEIAKKLISIRERFFKSRRGGRR